MSDAVLDRPEVRWALFHPRQEEAWGLPMPGIRPVSLDVEPGVTLAGRLYPAGPQAPVVLYFHGNGEIAADYDDIASLYTELGITLLVIDYRGYGASGGWPTAAHLLTDAVTVFEELSTLLEEQGLTPSRLHVMGRSLGSAAAIEVARHAGNRLAGLIVESGFADTFALLVRLGVRVRGADEERDGFGNTAKMESIAVPTIVIHGRDDVLIPAADGQELYRRSAATDKRLLLIPGAGHNDLLWVGRAAYFEAIHTLVRG
jgi:pimeloyl-ACP methyl ester carboxylesterase